MDWKNNKNWIIIIVLIILIFFVWQFLSSKPSLFNSKLPPGVKMEFSSKGCMHEAQVIEHENASFEIVDIPGKSSEEWIDDNTLEIIRTVEINCAEEILDGYAQFSGDEITLIFYSPGCDEVSGWNPRSWCALCFCSHEITYRFYNLEKKYYYIIFKRLTKEGFKLSSIKAEFDNSCVSWTKMNCEGSDKGEVPDRVCRFYKDIKRNDSINCSEESKSIAKACGCIEPFGIQK